LFTSSGKGRGQIKWDRGEIGEESREGRDDMEGREMEMHEK